MNKTKKNQILYGCRFLEEENWLSEQNKNGWKFKSLKYCCLYTFEKCESENIVYKLDIRKEKITEDYLQLYKDYNWEYCGRHYGWNYFRKMGSNVEVPEDRELFSDDESKIDMIKNIFKNKIKPLILLFFAVIIPNLLDINNIRKSLLGSIVYKTLILSAILYVYIFIKFGLKLRQLKKRNKSLKQIIQYKKSKSKMICNPFMRKYISKLKVVIY